LTTKDWLREYMWTVGAVIYVVFMFPIFYEYTIVHDISYGVFDIIASIGAFLVVCQMFVAALAKEPSSEQVQRSKETGQPV
jgi:hypothetical protein